MFTTADWTQPQIGGLLSEIIEKEERQLRAPKPRIEVQHIWDSETLKGRATLWKEVSQRSQPANMMELTRSKLGMSVPQLEDHEMRHSRSAMLAARRTRDSLNAMDRERAADARSTDTQFKSAASLFTPDDLQKLRPVYAPNERCATETTNQLIGLGSAKVPLQMSRYAKQRPFPPDFTNCRNAPDAPLVERMARENVDRAKPWMTPAKPPVQKMPAPHIVPRASDGSAFCPRPGDMPLVSKR